jgi:hypothetical protein
MKKVFLIVAIIIATNQIIAQNYKFGKVSEEELKEKFYPLDSSANAAVLYKKRHTFFQYSQGQGFSVVTEIHERIKIYNKEGVDWATKRIEYYNPSANRSEKVTNINAKTFVFEDGEIKEYKLKNNQIFNEENNKYWAEKKFTMPNIVDGCIVEWEYRLSSPYNGINKVEMQFAIPVKKFECSIEIPEYYKFNIRQIGSVKINSTKSVKSGSISLTQKYRAEMKLKSQVYTSFSNHKINFLTDVYKIENDNIPALLEEPYVNNIDNYRTSQHFELSSIKWPNEPIEYFSKSWEDVAKTIFKEEDFGGELRKTSYFEKEIDEVIRNNSDPSKLIVSIFEFVKQKVKWNDYRGMFSDNGVKKAYETGSGNTADINLMLVAMLRHARLNADPLILSTRDHGIPLFPTIRGFNYVIAAVELDGSLILLDATEKNSTPNVLPLRDLNFQGRIIRKDGSSELVDLTPKQSAITSSICSLEIDEMGEISGGIRKTYLNFHATSYRDKYGKMDDEKIIAKLEEENDKYEISEFKLSNKSEIYKPIIESYKFISENSVDMIGGKIYFNPLFDAAITENPFKLEQREFPIDFGTPINYKQRVSIKIPQEYSVESIPNDLAIGLPNNYGVYKIKIAVNDRIINVFSELKINTAIYPSTNYNEIKEFYKLIVNNNMEKVVLSKS